MATRDMAAALQRVETVLRRRPEAGIADDAPACAAWCGGARVVTRHPCGAEVTTDMPVELGGSGGQASAGWLLRAGLAACATTRIVMAAAVEGIALDALRAEVRSRSDARGLLGMAGADGSPVSAGPGDMQLHVQIAAAGVAPERLRALVEQCCRSSPVGRALADIVPVALQIDIGAD